MNNAQINIEFLKSLDLKIKNQILSNIANHYGISNDDAYNEIVDPDAESIMDYVTGPIRSTVSLFFNKFVGNTKHK